MQACTGAVWSSWPSLHLQLTLNYSQGRKKKIKKNQSFSSLLLCEVLLEKVPPQQGLAIAWGFLVRADGWGWSLVWAHQLGERGLKQRLKHYKPWIVASTKDTVVSSLCFLMEIAPFNIYKCVDFFLESMTKCVSAGALFIRQCFLLESSRRSEMLHSSTAAPGRPKARGLGVTESDNPS